MESLESQSSAAAVLPSLDSTRLFWCEEHARVRRTEKANAMRSWTLEIELDMHVCRPICSRTASRRIKRLC